MNRSQRRNQSSPKSSVRKSGLVCFTAVGIAGGSLGMAAPASAASSLTANSCQTINSQLALLAANFDGGTLDISYVGTCALDAAYWMQGNSTINGPESGDLILEVVFGKDYGFGTNSVLNISRTDMTYNPGMGSPASFFITAAQNSSLTLADVNFRNANLGRSAIYAEGNVEISDSSFTDLAANQGPGVLESTKNTFISNSSFNNNTGDTHGAIASSGNLEIEGSTFTSNSSDSSGGAIHSLGTLEISESTFESNASVDTGGAIWAGNSLEKKIVNSTFVGNEADFAAAIFLSEGGVVSNSTFWNNGDSDTYSISANQTDTYFFANILANDTPSSVKLIDPAETVTDLGANLYTDASFDDNTDGEGSSALVTAGDLKLSPLASANASTTETVAIGADSVAHDYYQEDSAGVNPTNGGLITSLLAVTDQRGADRPLSFGYDVGAYESREKPNPSPSETPEDDSETLADTGLADTQANYLGLIGLGLAAILGGSVGLVRRRRKA